MVSDQSIHCSCCFAALPCRGRGFCTEFCDSWCFCSKSTSLSYVVTFARLWNRETLFPVQLRKTEMKYSIYHNSRDRPIWWKVVRTGSSQRFTALSLLSHYKIQEKKRKIFHSLLFNLLATNGLVMWKGNAEKWAGQKVYILDAVFKNLVCWMFLTIVYKI